MFGTAAFDTVPLAIGEYNGKAKEQSEERADKLLALFNAATLPFYRGQFEPNRGQHRTEQLRNAAQWCVDRNLTVKEFPLTWHTMCADWLLPLSKAEILQEQVCTF